METRDNEVTLEDLEKSWNDSKAALADLLGVDELRKSSDDVEADEELSKAKDKDMDYDEEDEDEDEDDDMEKSLEDTMSEDSDAEAAMDVEPFLRQLVKSLDEKFASLEAQIKAGKNTDKAFAKAISSIGDQQMLIANTVEAIGGQPVPSKSVLRKSGDRFEAQNEDAGDELNMTRDQILAKSLELRKDGKLEMRDVTKIETRLNKGIALDPRVVKLLKEAK